MDVATQMMNAAITIAAQQEGHGTEQTAAHVTQCRRQAIGCAIFRTQEAALAAHAEGHAIQAMSIYLTAQFTIM